MLIKNLELKKNDDCKREELAMFIGDVHIGFVVNMIATDRGVWNIDGIVVGRHKTLDKDFILAIEFNSNGTDLLDKRTATAGFTKRIMKLMGFKGSDYNCRFWRNYIKDNDGKVYDIAGNLMYDKPVNTEYGELLSYPAKLSKRAIEIIDRFGIISTPRRRKIFR